MQGVSWAPVHVLRCAKAIMGCKCLSATLSPGSGCFRERSRSEEPISSYTEGKRHLREEPRRTGQIRCRCQVFVVIHGLNVYFSASWVVFSYNHHEGKMHFLLLEGWIIFCLKLALAQHVHTHAHTHWMLYRGLIMAIWCLSWCRRCSQPSVSWLLMATPHLVEPRRIGTKDVSRGCQLSRGGFWRTQVSSSEPERKKERKDVWITDSCSLISPTLTQWVCFLPLTANGRVY